MLDAFRYKRDEFSKINKPSRISLTCSKLLTSSATFPDANSTQFELAGKSSLHLASYGGGVRRAIRFKPQPGLRRILSIVLPLANSSINLLR